MDKEHVGGNRSLEDTFPLGSPPLEEASLADVSGLACFRFEG